MIHIPPCFLFFDFFYCCVNHSIVIDLNEFVPYCISYFFYWHKKIIPPTSILFVFVAIMDGLLQSIT